MLQKIMRNCFLVAQMGCAVAADALPAFKGRDLSGTYACTGKDAHDGDYKATVTLTLDRKHSYGTYGAYQFMMAVEGFGNYPGAAAADGDVLAITFANTDPSKKDYGTGIARVSTGVNGRPKFHKYYYQLEYEGSNHGIESCARN